MNEKSSDVSTDTEELGTLTTRFGLGGKRTQTKALQ
jgi:hypothetical protein